MRDLLYDQAARLCAEWTLFTRATFQRRMRVGFATRDRLLLQLEEAGVIERTGTDRWRVVA